MNSDRYHTSGFTYIKADKREFFVQEFELGADENQTP